MVYVWCSHCITFRRAVSDDAFLCCSNCGKVIKMQKKSSKLQRTKRTAFKRLKKRVKEGEDAAANIATADDFFSSTDAS